MYAMVPSVAAMPPEPISSSILRPSLSISMIATTVTTMLVTEVITVIRSDSDSPKPTARQSTEE